MKQSNSSAADAIRALHIVKATCVAGMVVAHGLYWAATDSGDLLIPQGSGLEIIAQLLVFVGFLPLLLPFTAGCALYTRSAELKTGPWATTMQKTAAEAILLIGAGMTLNVLASGMHAIWAWNVLQFFGIALMILVPVQRLAGRAGLAMIAVTSLILAAPVRHWCQAHGDPVWGRILAGDTSDFHSWPLLPWLPTIVAGYLAADLVMNLSSTKKRGVACFIIGIAAMLVAALAGDLSLPFDRENLIGPAMMIPSPMLVVGIIGVGFVLVAAASLISPHVRLAQRGPILSFSRAILWVYIVHMVVGNRLAMLGRVESRLDAFLFSLSPALVLMWVVSVVAALLLLSWGAGWLALLALDRRFVVGVRRVEEASSSPETHTIAPRIAPKIAIVGCGCILPGAANVEEYWNLVAAGRRVITEVPEHRWPSRIHVSSDGRDETSCSNHAGIVDSAILDNAAAGLGIDPAKSDRLTILTLEAVRQAVAHLAPEILASPRTAVLLGCMDFDESTSRESFKWERGSWLAEHVAAVCGNHADAVQTAVNRIITGWQRSDGHYSKRRMPSSVLAEIRRRFGPAGPAGLVDAACASSLAAVANGARALVDNEVDLALVGGIESNLGPDTFALFSVLGALSVHESRPLDSSSGGLTQSEGAVILALERLEDAHRRGHQVLAVLDGVGAASDGRSSSLFAPTVKGQLAALKKAWSGIDRRTVSYIECHATGTAVGDQTEVNSTAQYFGSVHLPIGSVKALIGHTKGAAGAASMLKALLMLQHHQVPPTPISRKPVTDGTAGPYVAIKAAPIPEGPARIGVSSFGFGGINHHVVIASGDHGNAAQNGGHSLGLRPTPEIVVVAENHASLDGIREAVELTELRLPPLARPQIDGLQLAALVACQRMFKAIGFDLSRIDRDRVAVLSTSVTGLDGALHLGHRILLREIVAELPETVPAHIRDAVAEARHSLPSLTEESGPGILNNVMAGRIAGAFDLGGPSLNVDAELGSEGLAWWLGRGMLGREADLLILAVAEEQWDDEKQRLIRHGVQCRLLATEAAAWQLGLPMLSRLGKVAYHA